MELLFCLNYKLTNQKASKFAGMCRCALASCRANGRSDLHALSCQVEANFRKQPLHLESLEKLTKPLPSMEDDGPDSYMDLDEFLTFRNILYELPDTVVDVLVEADDIGLQDSTPCSPYPLNPESPIAAECLIPSDCKNISRDSDSDEGRGGSVTSESPSNTSNPAVELKPPRKKKAKTTNEWKTKRHKGKDSRKITQQQEEGETIDGNQRTCATDGKDEKYWTRRKRNNLAAKKSRDLKKQQELYTAQRASCLEKENGELKKEIARLKDHLNSLNDAVKQNTNDTSQS